MIRSIGFEIILDLNIGFQIMWSNKGLTIPFGIKQEPIFLFKVMLYQLISRVRNTDYLQGTQKNTIPQMPQITSELQNCNIVFIFLSVIHPKPEIPE